MIFLPPQVDLPPLKYHTKWNWTLEWRKIEISAMEFRACSIVTKGVYIQLVTLDECIMCEQENRFCSSPSFRNLKWCSKQKDKNKLWILNSWRRFEINHRWTSQMTQLTSQVYFFFVECQRSENIFDWQVDVTSKIFIARNNLWTRIN